MRINNLTIKERIRWAIADIMMVPGFILCCILILFGVVELDDNVKTSENCKKNVF